MKTKQIIAAGGLALSLAAGIGLGAVIHGWVPEDFFATYAGADNPFGVLVAVRSLVQRTSLTGPTRPPRSTARLVDVRCAAQTMDDAAGAPPCHVRPALSISGSISERWHQGRDYGDRNE